MEGRFTWDEAKRRKNLAKHGLDFRDAGRALASRYRLDITRNHHGECRVMSITYELGFLAVVTIVHTHRDETTRIISFRRASREEREVYDGWLENEYDES